MKVLLEANADIHAKNDVSRILCVSKCPKLCWCFCVMFCCCVGSYLLTDVFYSIPPSFFFLFFFF